MADDSRILADQETGLQPPCDERSRDFHTNIDKYLVGYRIMYYS